jgi:hypothetical protein
VTHCITHHYHTPPNPYVHTTNATHIPSPPPPNHTRNNLPPPHAPTHPLPKAHLWVCDHVWCDG